MNDTAWRLRHLTLRHHFEKWWKGPGRGFGTGQYPWKVWQAAVEWVKTTQLTWNDLSEEEALQELRKGEESVFYPLFHYDPTIWATCPNHGRTPISADGICQHCGYDFGKDL